MLFASIILILLGAIARLTRSLDLNSIFLRGTVKFDAYNIVATTGDNMVVRI